MNSDYKSRFLRNIGIMSNADLHRIKSTSIAIGGLGLGGAIFLNLVRLGFERFHVADPDVYERTNINRQRMAKETTVGVRKDSALIDEALQINPDVKISSFPEGVSSQNVSAFLEGIDWVVDVIDVFAVQAKLALNAEARRRGLPLASCGAIGFAASVIVFDQTSPAFAELTGMAEDLPFGVNMNRFVRFISPRIPPYMSEQLDRALDGEGHIPFVCPGVELTAALAANEVVKGILGIGRMVRAPSGIHIDLANLTVETFHASFLARDYKSFGSRAS